MAASMVGTPLACDAATLQGTRMEYARVCIELDATLPPVHSFQVASSLTEEPITVDVVYEWKPSRCSKCNVFGHSCKTKEVQVRAAEVDKVVTEAKGKEMIMEEPQPTMGQVVLHVSPHVQPEKSKQGATQGDNRELEDTVSEASVDQSVHTTQREKEHVPSTQLQHGLDKGKLPQCVESKMDTISTSEEPSEGGASSSQGTKGMSNNANNSPSPKAKKKKGKKKREAASLR
ncbi:hypothetical protein OIU76_028832 [Salix suchowensis]|nr:hypothetical protein OIU76_028832 [Salix suchowensis]